MTSQYDNKNKGALWINQNKSEDKHPHFTGEIDVEGKVYRIAGWKKENPSGNQPVMSLQVSEPQKKNDGIPF